jgi:hypothetical protein
MRNRLLFIVAIAALSAESPTSAAGPDVAGVGVFFERHCYGCHSGQKPEAGLDLATLRRDLSDPASVAMFVRIHDRIAAGEMPPADEERPGADAIAAVTRLLDEQLVAADRARIVRDGRLRMRRLTRLEYENTLRDLLALDRLEIQEMLPPDGQVAGIDKVASGLEWSPVLVKAYAEAAEKALNAAIGTRSTAPPVFKQRIYPASLFKFGGNMAQGTYVLLKGLEADPLMPLKEPPDPSLTPAEKAERERQLLAERKKLVWGGPASKSQGAVGMLVGRHGANGPEMGFSTLFAGPYRLRVSTWGFSWNKGAVEPIDASQTLVLRAHQAERQQNEGRLLAAYTAPSLAPREQEIVTWLAAREALVMDPVSIDLWRFSDRGPWTATYEGPGVALDWLEVEGPIYELWPPESHRRLFGDLPIAPLPDDATAIPPRRDTIKPNHALYKPHCGPGKDFPAATLTPPLETVQSSTPAEDARRLFAAFLPRAFRRPVGADEIEPYVALVLERLAARECFEDAMRRAYVAILSSPEMLLLPAGNDGSQTALASRLAYWLWNSPPDDQLLALAEQGALAGPQVLHAQVDRLLADPRSDRFIENFTDQWLELRRINETTPDTRLYPEYGFMLHEGMVAEPRAFFRELIANDLPIASLVDADFAMLTQRLAEHYGIAGVDGVDVRRVELPPGSHRGGFLTQAAILKLTANGTVTSPVKRGVWVMDRLFDSPSPPPPPGVSSIDPDTRGATTVREQLALHRNNTGCAVCHTKIDPAGFALECFDPVGGFRERYRSTGKGDVPPEAGAKNWRVHYRLGLPVDATGELADGRPFAGVDDLTSLLAADPKPLARAFVAHLSRYATGSQVSYAERRVIESIVESSSPTQYGVRSLIHALAESSLFLAGVR